MKWWTFLLSLFFSVFLNAALAFEPNTTEESNVEKKLIFSLSVDEDASTCDFIMASQPSLNMIMFQSRLKDRTVSCKVAKLALANLSNNMAYDDDQIASLLSAFIDNKDRFDYQTMVDIFYGIYATRPTYRMACNLLDLIEYLGDEFGCCLNAPLGRDAIKDVFQEDDSYPVCTRAMLKAAWFNAEDLSRYISSTYRSDALMLQELQRLVVDENSAARFIEAIPEIRPHHEPFLRWIIYRPWATSQIVVRILSKKRVEEFEFGADLLFDERANIDWIKLIQLDFQDMQDTQIYSIFQRILFILKRNGDNRSLAAYLSSLSLDSCAQAQSLARIILKEFSQHVWPPASFFRECRIIGHEDVNFGRKRIFLMESYLSLFRDQMSEDDIDTILEFAFTSRGPSLNAEQAQEWTELLITIMQKVHRADGTDLCAVQNQASLDGNIEFLRSFFSTLSEEEQLRYIERSNVGKYETVFLMLTNPNLGQVYKALLGKLDCKSSFFDNARRLYSSVLASQKFGSFTIASAYSFAWQSYQNNNMAQFYNDFAFTFRDNMAHWNNKALSEDHWMLVDMARMMLKYLERQPVPQADVENLRAIVEADRPKKHDREDAAAEEIEPASKRQCLN